MMITAFKARPRGVTLVELILTTIVAGFVVAGVFSAEYALRKMDKDLSEGTTQGFQLTALAENIRQAARQLHGDLTNNASNLGFHRDDIQQTFCFRYDDNNGGSGYTPADYTDDNSFCFTLLGADVYRCEITSVPNNTTACVSSDLKVGELDADYFTTLPSITRPRIMKNMVTGMYYFEMDLVSPEGAQMKIRENASGF